MRSALAGLGFALLLVAAVSWAQGPFVDATPSNFVDGGGNVNGDLTLGLGNRLILDEANTSVRGSADNVISFETNGADRMTLGNTGLILSSGQFLLMNDMEFRVGRVQSTTPTEPRTCASTTDTGSMIYVDDTDDAGRATACLCIATGDDGAGTPNAFDWVRLDDTLTACPFF